MALSTYRLNFARAFRPKQFCDVVGQQTPLRLLEHSLAKQIYFPVYLFSGMRGSGKTTVGRLFAAAVNCEKFESFVSTGAAWSDLPCGKCHSCELMARGEHPDFIEVDAASYTGVENIRQIVDEAQFLPVVGRKKVYLVDEAHMLSKSAFNAFLKMLEEPPSSVLFLLATTEAHKIIDTVRSRSFQLFFDPLPFDLLADYLVKVAEREGFVCEKEAADLLSQQSEGSVRDALTALEQAWVAGETVTAALVKELFGLASYARVFELFSHVISRNNVVIQEDLALLANKNRSLASLWEQCVEVVTAVVWAERGVFLPNLELYKDSMHALLTSAPRGFFVRVLDLLFKYEPLLQKTRKPFHLFERFIMQCIELVQGSFIQSTPIGSGGGIGTNTFTRPSHVVGSPESMDKTPEKNSTSTSSFDSKSSLQGTGQRSSAGKVSGIHHPEWSEFVSLVRPLCTDPILLSVLLSGTFVTADSSAVRVSFPRSFAFYQDLLVSSRQIWQLHLEKVFGEGVMLVPSFSLEKNSLATASSLVAGNVASSSSEAVVGKTLPVSSREAIRGTRVAQRADDIIDIADQEKWPVANALTKVLPGTVKLYKE